MADKPEIVAMSKLELTGAAEVRDRLEQEIGRPVLALSAVTGAGLSDVVGQVVRRLREITLEAAPVVRVVPPHERPELQPV